MNIDKITAVHISDDARAVRITVVADGREGEIYFSKRFLEKLLNSGEAVSLEPTAL